MKLQPSQTMQISLSYAFCFFCVRLFDFYYKRLNESIISLHSNISSGYSMSVRNNPLAGADIPADDLLSERIILSKSSGVIFPLPVSIMVPTIALTMFLRKRSALIVKTRVLPSGFHPALNTVQIFVLLSE